MICVMKIVLSVIYLAALLVNLFKKKKEITGTDVFITALLATTIALFWIE